ncbi:MAG: hypothetical protein EA387_15570 [Nitriliruptor sp.]|nr:MAG: hypothetical protein EA387_15570 [Nitriliruptor sp.]
MRITSSVTSVSWIPSEAITGPVRLPMDVGVGHYDDPPPDQLGDVGTFVAADRCRFANELAAWVEVDDAGRISDAGYAGAGHVGPTSMRLLGRTLAIPGVAYPLLQAEPEIHPDRVRFVQTAGGRTGVPMPRPVRRPPFVRVTSPTAWTTLACTIHSDGAVEHEVVDASPFPRHWIYGGDARLVAKSGYIDFQTWAEANVGDHTPWGESSTAEALVTEVETALERELSLHIMRAGERPELRRLAVGELLTRQGEPGSELFLLLDGVVVVEVDDQPLAELGPGSIVGERAVLEGGVRTATLRATTPVRVAVARGDQLDPAALTELASGHRREEQPS